MITLPAAVMAAGVPGTIDAETGQATLVDLTVDPYKTFDNAAHVANGVALRNSTQGWIHLRGMPLTERLRAAYLYWNIADDRASGTNTKRATFNGNKVTGVKVADSADACWGNVGNHTYRANVRKYLSTTQVNGNHEVVVQFSGLTSTSGQNAWSPMETQQLRVNGATLVVIYTADAGQVFLYDNLNGSMFSGTANFTLNHVGALPGPGLLTMSGADGQRGGGHDNGSSNETTFFNGIQIAGPPTAASDWDGSDGLPLTQLYDVHTHQVELGDGPAILTYNASGDCLVPVMFALQTP
ncbi:MAG: DUF3344 domain-containing protein [Acidimicrobiia bacterium]|nr:DUF3344 domain-containing protein [Acidimicrobiia bacterium]